MENTFTGQAVESDGPTVFLFSEGDVQEEVEIETTDSSPPYCMPCIPSDGSKQWCPKKTDKPNSISTSERFSGSILQCSKCSSMTSSQQSSSRRYSFGHSYSETGDGYVCLTCGCMLDDNDGAGRHQEGSRSSPDDSIFLEFACRRCPAVFDSVDDIKAHLRTHGSLRLDSLGTSLVKNFVCRFCLRKFDIHQLVVDHQRLVHSDKVKARLHRERRPSPPRRRPHLNPLGLEAPLFCCQICRRNFDDVNIFRIHIRLHQSRVVREEPPVGILSASPGGSGCVQPMQLDCYDSDDGVPFDLDDEESESMLDQKFAQLPSNWIPPHPFGVNRHASFRPKRGRKKGRKSNETRSYYKYRCAFCGIGHDDETLLRRHIMDVHPVSRGKSIKTGSAVLPKRKRRWSRTTNGESPLAARGSLLEKAILKKARENLEGLEIGAEVFSNVPEQKENSTATDTISPGLRRSARIANAAQLSSRKLLSNVEAVASGNDKNCSVSNAERNSNGLTVNSHQNADTFLKGISLCDAQVQNSASESEDEPMTVENIWGEEMIVGCEVEC